MLTSVQKKEKNNTIHLWGFILLFVLMTFLFIGQKETNKLKASIWDSLNEEERALVQDIEIKRYFYNPSLFLAIIKREKDWQEELKVGIWEDEKIRWLTIKNSPTEQSILSTRFLRLVGFKNPALEVYGQTHMGNGDLYLYEINVDGLALLLNIPAVDFQSEIAWHPDNYSRYGYMGCGQSYEGGKLAANYRDVNDNGTVDIVLSGKINVDCERNALSGYLGENISKVRVAEIPIYHLFKAPSVRAASKPVINN
jgi:hypothetical protein